MTTTCEDHVARSAIGLFADPMRPQCVRLPAAEQMCACHLTAVTGARQSALSHHLKVVRQAGHFDTEPRERFGLRSTARDALAAQISDLADRARGARGHCCPC